MQTAWRTIVRDLVTADVIDKADAGVIEAAAVAWGRAREARAIVNREGLLAENSQGRVPHPALGIEERSWKEFRLLSENLPLSPVGRTRLGLKSKAPADQIDSDIGPPIRERFRPRVVGGNDAG